MKIYKMTNHNLSPEQRAELDGYEIVEPSEMVKSGLLQSPDTIEEISNLVECVLDEIKVAGATEVLCPGGSPAFNALFSNRAIMEGLILKFSHSVREFKETVKDDGSVVKTNIFRHVHFINVPEKYRII